MVKKRVDLAAITAISEQAAHIKNVDDGLSDKTKIKTKTITYPEFWESVLFNDQVKIDTIAGPGRHSSEMLLEKN